VNDRSLRAIAVKAPRLWRAAMDRSAADLHAPCTARWSGIVRECWFPHFNCSITVPSEIVGRATPVLLAFLAIHSRAARVLSSAPALSS
jgi:hypothetical protein